MSYFFKVSSSFISQVMDLGHDALTRLILALISIVVILTTFLGSIYFVAFFIQWSYGIIVNQLFYYTNLPKDITVGQAGAIELLLFVVRITIDYYVSAFVKKENNVE